MTTIYKIYERALWEAAEAKRLFVGSPADVRDGFIHFSTAAQLPGTAAKHFAGLSDLILVAVDAVNRAPEFMMSKQLIAERSRVNPSKLGDERVAMKDVRL